MIEQCDEEICVLETKLEVTRLESRSGRGVGVLGSRVELASITVSYLTLGRYSFLIGNMQGFPRNLHLGRFANF